MTTESVRTPLPRKFLHRVLDVRVLTDNTYTIRCERRDLEFRAGQCANLGFPGAGINREYSAYSGENDPYLDFLIREVKDGLVSVQLKSLRTGDNIELHGFYGDFRIKDPDDGREYILIATGTGISPFHSFVLSYPNLNYKVLHGVRHADERYDVQDYDPDRFVACVSREEGGDFPGRVTDYLRQSPVSVSALYYLCGYRAMISEAYGLLRSMGVPSDNIVSEAWF